MDIILAVFRLLAYNSISGLRLAHETDSEIPIISDFRHHGQGFSRTNTDQGATADMLRYHSSPFASVVLQVVHQIRKQRKSQVCP